MLTRKSLKAMGLTDEQVDSIVEMHTETVDGLKEKLKTVEDKAKTADDLQKELDGLKAKGGEDYKARAEKAEKELKDYKAEVAAKETRAAKEKAVRAYLESKTITGNNQDIAMLAVSGLIDGLDLDGENIKDTKSLDDLVSGKLSRLAVTQKEKGANTATPPQNHSGAPMTRTDVFARDDKGRFKLDTSQRINALAKIIQNEQKGV